jgi:hypothetical protein
LHHLGKTRVIFDEQDASGHNAYLKHGQLLSRQVLLLSTDSKSGTAELPLPCGERAGVRGDQTLDSS